MKLPIKVVPGASRDGIAGWLGNALKVRVSAPAEGGRANAAVVKVIADALGVSGKDVVIVRGKTAARKVVEVEGLGEGEVFRRLPKP